MGPGQERLVLGHGFWTTGHCSPSSSHKRQIRGVFVATAKDHTLRGLNTCFSPSGSGGPKSKSRAGSSEASPSAGR